MDKASDFGSGDCRFESCQGRIFFFLILKIPDAVEADRVVCVQALLAGFWDKVWGNELVRKLLTEPEASMSLAGSEPVAGTFFS